MTKPEKLLSIMARFIRVIIFVFTFVFQEVFLIPSCFSQMTIPDEIITNPLRSDGFGAQFQTIIISAIYAELNNMKYQYTPFKKMEHNYENDTTFIQKKEKLINFIGNFEINEDLNIQIQRGYGETGFLDNNTALCANSLSLKKIKEIFRSNKNRQDYFSDENLNIAIHIRRPNAHDNRTGGADVPDSIYLKAINFLRSIYSSKNRQFHIYSQGNVDDFKTIYNSDDVIFHINASIENTFSSMVFADVLVTSQSSFSYTAGLISDGVVYFIPFWHSPLPHWIRLNLE